MNVGAPHGRVIAGDAFVNSAGVPFTIARAVADGLVLLWESGEETIVQVEDLDESQRAHCAPARAVEAAHLTSELQRGVVDDAEIGDDPEGAE
jgi:hypothetical protein